MSHGKSRKNDLQNWFSDYCKSSVAASFLAALVIPSFFLPVLSFNPYSHQQVSLYTCDTLPLPSSSLCFLSRFVTIYRGPSHTYKVQRLTESSSYSFRIQAISDAGEGPFSDTHTFCTTKSVPPALKGKFCCRVESVCVATGFGCTSNPLKSFLCSY